MGETTTSKPCIAQGSACWENMGLVGDCCSGERCNVVNPMGTATCQEAETAASQCIPQGSPCWENMGIVGDCCSGETCNVVSPFVTADCQDAAPLEATTS